MHTTDHLQENGKNEDSPGNVKNHETRDLIERMKGNSKINAIDLAERYSTIEDAHQLYHGRPRPEAVDII